MVLSRTINLNGLNGLFPIVVVECSNNKYTGVPDRMILLPGGRIYFVELKAPGKKERPRQRYVQAILQRLGFTVFASVDSIEKVDEIIRELHR